MKLEDDTYQVINAAMEVLNTLGNGILEKPYEQAMAIELGLRKLTFVQQMRYGLTYKSNAVGVYMPDLIAFDAVVVETRSIGRITEQELGQMLIYLRITGKEVGLILNFKRAKLEWKRVVLASNV